MLPCAWLYTIKSGTHCKTVLRFILHILYFRWKFQLEGKESLTKEVAKDNAVVEEVDEAVEEVVADMKVPDMNLEEAVAVAAVAAGKALIRPGMMEMIFVSQANQ